MVGHRAGSCGHWFDPDAAKFVTVAVPEATVDMGLELRVFAVAFGPYMHGEWFLTHGASRWETMKRPDGSPLGQPIGSQVFSWGLRIAGRF